ncbi:HAMP domain-containing histidine kinase [Pseudooceanicola sp. CBS1P-1]|uniref:histidine kinase n=1 Tax=Pseudooceanicola albus TaxID=2692189 RepID=A0A6L7G3M6_9RHOB|nr:MULTISPECIES: HAMP domain-containing sensor histidine kinase [Pseudooceanicola]MBT9384888.1 HAMP domain-containing histidine kinase [Pseudooceanicola endophyticus]MXN18118.1 sensor histidine kinase [Pseudooceanicola albus]
MIRSLSGRFLILTALFVILAEVLILVPSVARFREDYLLSRLERAQIASLSLLADDNKISPSLEKELLKNAEVYNVVLRRDEARQLVLSSPVPGPVQATFDLRDATAAQLIHQALITLFTPENHVIRVIGNPVREAGLLIEVTMPSGPLRTAMIDYGRNMFLISAIFSVFTALLLFVAVRSFILEPMKRFIGEMRAYTEDPEDARRVIEPKASVRDLRDAEEALLDLETQLSASLKQKERLAQLGSAVAKISHDLRNILTSAQLFTDRLEVSEDPAVKRLAPKVVNSITRAVNLCEATLAFGKSEEPAPRLSHVALMDVVGDVIDSERLAVGEHDISFAEDIPATLRLRADPEQLHRVIFNLVRNARQAIENTGAPGEIAVAAEETDSCWTIRVADTGPGLPPKARENLFTPFSGGARKGGTGLGLAIAAELVRGHGGHIELEHTGPDGTVFLIYLPKDVASRDLAAQ